MKKCLTLICMIACILGLTACGAGENLSQYEQDKLTTAQQRASIQVVPLFVSYMDDEMAKSLDMYTLDEITVYMGDVYQQNITGYVMKGAIESFHSAKEDTGAIIGTGEATGRIDGDTIIVEVPVQGEKKNAVAEIIFSNDMFLAIESASLTPEFTTGELMGMAALNTVIGMGTVFAVLILISLIISCFGFIPKLQAKFAGKKPAETAAVESAAAQDTVQEEIFEETDDLELVAVIAAAVAACEGAASTDGFVVRSIRRRA